MKWKKIAVFGNMIMMCAVLATGCSTDTQEKNNSTIQEEKQETPKDGQKEKGNPDGIPPAKPDDASPMKPDSTPPEKPDGDQKGQPPGGFGGSRQVTNGSSANTITEDSTINGKTYSSTGDDENALRIDGATVTLDDITIEKTGGDSSNTENGDFYGQNAGLLVLNGGKADIINTDCEIHLENVTFTLANDVFLRVEGNSSSRGWGTEGANGGDVIFTAVAQKMEGNILVDDISTLELTMKEGTAFTGTINPEGEGGTVKVSLDDDSVWTLTGDSYISSFDGNAAYVDTNGYHLYVGGEEFL